MGRTVRNGRLAVSGFFLFGIVLATQIITSGWRTQVYADQFPSLQQAVDALPPIGGTVSLPCGSYGPVTISKPNVAIIGSGDCSIITAPAAGSTGIVTVTRGATHTIISSLRILGQAIDPSTVQRCVYLTGGSSGTTIQHVKFGGNTTGAGCNIQIHVDSTSSGNLITMNTFMQVIGVASVRGDGMLIEANNRNTIAQNVSLWTASRAAFPVYPAAASSARGILSDKLASGARD